MEKQTEKRQQERRPFSYPVRIETGDPDKGTFAPVRFDGQGIDVSSGGLGLTSGMPSEVGQVMRLFLPLGTPETLVPVFSEVRWVRESEGGYRMGLQFI